jgi:hypothetical protein
MSLTFDLLVAAVGVLGVAGMAAAYQRSRDPFHPLVVACPIAMFVYGYMPWALRDQRATTWFVSVEGLERAQLVFLCLLAMFVAGGLVASRSARWPAETGAPRLLGGARRRLLAAGLTVGAIGLVAWMALIVSEGGLRQVYDQPHGGDVLHPSGWVREMPRLTLVGILLTMAASRALAPRLLALAMAAPHIVHTALGTRRGPLYVTVILLVVSFYVFEGRRPRFVASLAAGGALGLLLLLLLANRSRVYYGSQQSVTLDVTDSIAFRPNSGNDYLVAAGLVVAADRTGRFGWGLSYVEQLFLRPIPREWLPEKWDILQEETVTELDVASTLGWEPPPGWAPTLFAHLYTEFGWFSLAVSALLGWVYGWTWRRSVESPAVGWQALQVLMLVGLLHLITQGFWAMAVPLMLMFVPAWLALRWALERPFWRLRAAAPPLPPGAPAHGA